MPTNPRNLQLQQITVNVYDESGRAVNLLPTDISSGDGHVMVGLLPLCKGNDPDHVIKIMTKAKRDADVDAAMRAACIEMGWVTARRRPLCASSKGH